LLAVVVSLRTYSTVMAVTLGLIVVGAGNVRDYGDIPRVLSGERLSRVEETQTAIAELQARGLRSGYADYWTAYPIMYLSGERIVVAPALPLQWGSGVDRYPAYTRQIADVDRADQLFVLVDRACDTSGYRAALEAAVASYRVDDVARWSLLWDIQAPPGGDAEVLLTLRTAIAARQSC